MSGSLPEPPDDFAVPAYEVGRLLSRLCFHAEQAELGFKRHVEETEAVRGKLAPAARLLRPAPERLQFRLEIEHNIDKIGQGYHIEEFAEQVHRLRSELLNGRDDEANMEEELAVLVAPIRTRIHELRQALTAGLGDRVALAEQLGEVVEWGIPRGPCARQ